MPALEFIDEGVAGGSVHTHKQHPSNRPDLQLSKEAVAEHHVSAQEDSPPRLPRSMLLSTALVYSGMGLAGIEGRAVQHILRTVDEQVARRALEDRYDACKCNGQRISCHPLRSNEVLMECGALFAVLCCEGREPSVEAICRHCLKRMAKTPLGCYVAARQEACNDSAMYVLTGVHDGSLEVNRTGLVEWLKSRPATCGDSTDSEDLELDSPANHATNSLPSTPPSTSPFSNPSSHLPPRLSYTRGKERSFGRAPDFERLTKVSTPTRSTASAPSSSSQPQTLSPVTTPTRSSGPSMHDPAQPPAESPPITPTRVLVPTPTQPAASNVTRKAAGSNAATPTHAYELGRMAEVPLTPPASSSAGNPSPSFAPSPTDDGVEHVTASNSSMSWLSSAYFEFIGTRVFPPYHFVEECVEMYIFFMRNFQH